MKTILLTILTIGLITGPFLMIWSLNTVFNLGIGYNGWNWLAVLFLMTAFSGTKLNTSK
jgi:hypothetical protein